MDWKKIEKRALYDAMKAGVISKYEYRTKMKILDGTARGNIKPDYNKNRGAFPVYADNSVSHSPIPSDLEGKYIKPL